MWAALPSDACYSVGRGYSRGHESPPAGDRFLGLVCHQYAATESLTYRRPSLPRKVCRVCSALRATTRQIELFRYFLRVVPCGLDQA
jgi:hypothetical protein